jgi:hypothetical protein
MRVRINVDYVVSPRVKRALKLVVPAFVLLVGGVALAGVPHTFNDGDLLSAQSMNDNFSNLDSRVAKLEALAGTGDGGAVTGAVIWKDSTGAVMPVVRLLGDSPSGGWPYGFEIFDPSSKAVYGWLLTSPVQGPFEALNAGNAPCQEVWSTGNCTGTAYVATLPVQGYAFHLAQDPATWYKIPDGTQATQGAFASVGTGPGSCAGNGGSSFLVPLSSLTTLTPPTAPPGVPPYHPGTVP